MKLYSPNQRVDPPIGPGDRTSKMNDGETESNKNRLLDIDRAKGLAIALVVWGHVPSGTFAVSHLWYLISISVIYAFHMPLFMYLSGFVFFLVDGPQRFWKAPRQQIWARFDRLIVPLIALVLLIITGKLFVSSLGGVTDSVNSFGSGLTKVITNAPDNPLLSVWYLIVLFVYTILTPFLWKLGSQKLWLMIIVGVLGWIAPLPDDYYLRRIGHYFIFFAIGGAFAIYRELILSLLKRYFPISAALFAFSIANYYDSKYALLICGITSILAIHGLFLQRFLRRDRIFIAIGGFSMAIYLFNTIFIGVAKLLIPSSFSKSDVGFFLTVAFLFLIGLMGPIVLRNLMAITPFAQRYVRYLD